MRDRSGTATRRAGHRRLTGAGLAAAALITAGAPGTAAAETDSELHKVRVAYTCASEDESYDSARGSVEFTINEIVNDSDYFRLRLSSDPGGFAMPGRPENERGGKDGFPATAAAEDPGGDRIPAGTGNVGLMLRPQRPGGLTVDTLPVEVRAADGGDRVDVNGDHAFRHRNEDSYFTDLDHGRYAFHADDLTFTIADRPKVVCEPEEDAAPLAFSYPEPSNAWIYWVGGTMGVLLLAFLVLVLIPVRGPDPLPEETPEPADRT